MERKEYRVRRTRGAGQRIGPALRTLRRREGLTLDQLARRSGISRAHISRIEQGRSEVTLQTLMSLSASLGVDVNYFASYQQASSQTEANLRDMLARIDLPPEAIPSLLSLSFEAQGALLDGLQWATLTDAGTPLREQELVDHIRAHGVGASISNILTSIPQFGLDVEGFCRAMTQLEEFPGERLVMSDRLLSVTTPMGGQIDALDVFHSIFQTEPETPALVGRWSQALQSAVTHSVERFESRTIYSLASINRYIETGHWGAGVDVHEAVVNRHISDLARALRTLPKFKVGLLDGHVPFGLLVKERQSTIVHLRQGVDAFPGQAEGPGVALRSNRPDVVRAFREYFDSVWERIPLERKEAGAVASWLEARISAQAR